MARAAKATDALPTLQPASLVPPLVKWFGQSRRDLPWRAVNPATGLRNPYFSLVSELMLQQTQVSRVLEKFEPFITRFPTVRALAAASEDDVLSAWTGLGYYRRARLLHAAAKAIVEQHDGVVPRSVDALVALPGLGRYTAGAIASIAFHEPAPLVDTNVSRVMLRVGGVPLPADDKTALAWVWRQAESLAQHAHAHGEVAACNEALMELGALICTSEEPACLMCPLRDACAARATGKQHQIPLPKKQAKRKPAAHTVVLLTVGERVLVERRPGVGLWAGLWQAPTIESDTPLSDRAIRKRLALPRRLALRQRSDFLFQTTHRDVTFRVFEGRCRESDVPDAPGVIRRVVSREELASLGMSSPMRRILLENDGLGDSQETPATKTRASRKIRTQPPGFTR